MSSTVQPGSEWWRRAVIHQVYIRSFADRNGDGIGDIAGIQDRLPYLRDLGVDGIWINPWYASPMVDAGYDVSDHRDVDPMFGTLADAEGLIAAAHGHGLRVIVDLVPNHTSDRHAWFQEALAAAPDSAARRRYHFHPGRGADGAEPPNDWRSCFGGPAWTPVPGESGGWYLHLCAPQQPDLNWGNPEVREEFLSIMRFWLARGVDGFRVDVANGLAKAAGLPDVGYADLPLPAHEVARAWDVADHPHWDREEVHDILRSWRARLQPGHPDMMFVAEAEMGDTEACMRYVRPDELHSTFNFAFLKVPWDAAELRRVIDDTIRGCAAVGASPSWVLGNHDLPRVVSRYGGGEAGLRRARAASALMLALPGGAYIYQGDELGLEEVEHFRPEERDDPIFARTGGAVPGRDGCRVPLPWSGEAPPFGFSPEGAPPPWLRQPAGWARLTAERQAADPGSTLSLHRHLLRLRRELTDLAGPDLRWLPGDDGVLHFARGEGLRVLVNLGGADVALPAGARVLVRSDPRGRADGHVAPDQAVWYAL
ncbi:MAG: alpha-amylase family glycosyl hydrolase [Thermoleophilia bacterium]